MSLKTLLQALIASTDAPPTSISKSDIMIGFITPHEKYTIALNRDGLELQDGIREATLVLRGKLSFFQTLFDPQTENRADLLKQMSVAPNLPGKRLVVARMIIYFGLNIDIDAAEYPHPEYVFPLPMRYPATENRFKLQEYQSQPVPSYDPDQLPELIADAHPTWIEMYNKAWEISFSNLRQPEATSGFIANFIDTAFNDNTFMWDSCFMMMFGRYAQRIFNFMGTLDNFYAKQHDDGFMCREINTYTGHDLFNKLDPSSSGPPILAWTEWQYYQLTNDKDRLAAVFPVLIAYHFWWKDWRTWPDGSYFTTGWGSGMDNQSRVPDSVKYHQHYSWIDINMQQAMNCQILLEMAEALQRDEFNNLLHREYTHLRDYINNHMWDEANRFYYDRSPHGELSRVKSIGVFWGMLSDVIPPERLSHLIVHLNDPQTFKRPHRVPSQSADHPDYRDDGGYWLGGVWTPTNYMVLRGLTHHGQDQLAHEIAYNHVETVAQVFKETGTLWETYAPESVAPGPTAKSDFVGWTGVSAITIPIEYLLGLRATPTALIWDIRLTERQGVRRYPIGENNLIDLVCEARDDQSSPAQVSINTRQPFTLIVKRGEESQIIELTSGQHTLSL